MIKHLKSIALLMFSVLMLAACSKDDENNKNNPIDESLRITEIQEKMGNNYNTTRKFVYDDKNRISEVFESDWDYNDETGAYYLDEVTKYTFIWGADGKLQKVTSAEKEVDETQWEEYMYFTVTYNGSNITRVLEHRSSDGEKAHQYDFTWSNGKITKVVENESYETDLSYDGNGNCLSIESSSSSTGANLIYEYHEKTTNTHDLSRVNYCLYAPLEYFIVSNIEGIEIAMSKNNIIKSVYDYRDTRIDIDTNERIISYEGNSESIFSFVYDAEKATNYSLTSNGTYKIIDYINPNNNGTGNRETEVYNFKIFYNK